MAKKSADSRWSVLALLRFLLAMIVLSTHWVWFLPLKYPAIRLNELGGVEAVLSFLVISGYSIAHSITQKSEGFYKRRILRIYPLYVAAVLFSLVPFSTGAQILRDERFFVPRPLPAVVLGNIVFLQNTVCRAIESNPLVWTLGIEVLLYALAPWFNRRSSKFLLILAAVSAGMFAAYPYLHWDYYSKLLYGLPFLLMAWAWLCGFVLFRHQGNIALEIGLTILSTGLIVLNHSVDGPLSIVTIAVSTAVIALSPRIRLPQIGCRLFNFLGDLSYPLYLFHFPVFLLFYCILLWDSPFVLLIGAILVSTVMLMVDTAFKSLFRAGTKPRTPRLQNAV